RHLLIPAAADLVEFRLGLAKIMFAADPGVVERAGHHRIVGVDGEIGQVDRALVRAQQDLAPLLLPGLAEARIEGVDRDAGGVAWLELDAAGEAEPLAVVPHRAVARNARVEGKARRVAGGAGPVDATAVRRRGVADRGREEAGRAVDAVEPGLRPAHRVVAELERV